MIKEVLLAAFHGVFSWGGLTVMGITFIVDIFWANYNMTSADKKPLNAAFWSTMIVVGGTFSTQIWLDNKWVLVNSAIGAFIGTYWAVRNGKRKEEATTKDVVEPMELNNDQGPILITEQNTYGLCHRCGKPLLHGHINACLGGEKHG